MSCLLRRESYHLYKKGLSLTYAHNTPPLATVNILVVDSRKEWDGAGMREGKLSAMKRGESSKLIAGGWGSGD